jgi:tRNA-modifying protein YgfZ
MSLPSAACIAARESAALFVLQRSHIELTGKDRATFLHNFCTNDIKSLQPGQGCEAFVCNVKGRVLGHVTVFAEQHSLWLETVPGAAPGLIAHLDRYLIREDVQLHDRTAEVGELHLVGPKAIETLASMMNRYEQVDVIKDRLTALEANGSTALPPTTDCVRARAIEWLGNRSYLLSGLSSFISTLFVEAAADDVVLGTDADWQSLRIAAGFPQYGVDLTEENLPQEAARNDQAISFTKGCYLGQEPIARLDAMGHTNRELRRLRIDRGDPPTVPTGLVDAASGQEAGMMTSAAVAPDDPGVVALGMIKTNWQSPATTLRLAGDAISREVIVV